MSFSTLPAELKYEIINQIIPNDLNDLSSENITLIIRDLFRLSLINYDFSSISKIKFDKLKFQIFEHLKKHYKSDTPVMPKILAIRNHHFIFEETTQNISLNEPGSMLLDALSKPEFSNELNDHIHYLINFFPKV